ncbi:MAG: energy transducer TonB [Longimicrobiaceae bacterium]
MFNNLPASAGKKRGTADVATVSTSVIIHGLILAGAVAASVAMPAEVKDELVEYVELKPEAPPEPEKTEPEPEPEPPPPEPEPQAAPPVAKGFQDIVPPKEPPPKIPDILPDERAVNKEDFSGIGKSGGVAEGIDKGVRQSTAKREEPADAGVYNINVVEERPKIRNGADIQRQISRQYPPLLRDSGVNGNVVLQFVVSESGNVEPGSVTVVSASHDAFGDVARKITDRMKFSPAKVGGRAVRVMVTFPVTFNTK